MQIIQQHWSNSETRREALALQWRENECWQNKHKTVKILGGVWLIDESDDVRNKRNSPDKLKATSLYC